MSRDWRVESDYPKPDEVSLREWAWEFLRRNPKYIADWEQFAAILGDLAPKWPHLEPHDWSRVAARSGWWASDLPRDPSEPTYKWLARVGNPSPRQTAHILAERWGFEAFIMAPNAKYHFVTHTWNEMAGKTVMPGDGWPEWDNPRWQVVAFDLELPLDIQLEAAKETLKFEQGYRARQKLIHPRPAKRAERQRPLYPSYLRVLDAAVAGASRTEMAQVLVPHKSRAYGSNNGEKTIDNWLLAATKLRDEEYRYLPLDGSDRTSAQGRSQSVV